VAEVVGVVFPGGVKVYHFDPAGLELCRGDRVVVQTSSGPEIGQVVEPPHSVDDSEIQATLKKVARVATGEDLENLAASDDVRKQATDACRELIATHGLDMKLVGAEVGFGGEKITFNFFSEERVDFRALVADLAKTLKKRIELRQVGAREEARMVGGLGPCGRSLCCTLFSGDDDPVSIRMAKEQNLPLNPTKISGLCGRLMCCLKYEQEQYVSFRKEAPAKGAQVSTPTGEGKVSGYTVTKDAITVKLEDGSFSDVRLSSCRCQKDGTLVVVPEEEKPSAPVSWWDESKDGAGVAAEEDGGDGSSAAEADVALGGNGELGDKVVAEGSRSAQSRRSRGKRRGRGRGRARGQADAKTSGARGSAEGKPGSDKTAATDRRNESGQRKSDGQSRRGGSNDSPQQRTTRGSAGGQTGREGQGSGRSRRRRKPRRSGGGSGAPRDQ